MRGIVRLLAMLVVCFGVVGLASAAAGEEYPKQTIPTPPIPTPQTIPTPQAIPHEHEHGCEGHREHDGWRGKPAYGCDEARAECGDAHRCRAEAEKGPGKHHAAMGRCCGDRGGEDACASAKDDRDDDRDAYKSAEFPPKPGLKISQFVLYGERSVHLGDCDRVRGGDVGVRSFAEKSQDGQLRIGRDSFVEVSRLVVAPSVAVAHGVTLGPVAADQFRDDGIPLGTLAGFPASGMPPLPLAVGGGGGPDVSVGHDQALALLPGHYGTLTVQGVLLLNPGWYSVGKVQVGDHGRIVAITGDVRLDVAGTLTVGRHAAVYADFDLPARQFRISVAGFDADDTPAASIGEFSMMRALLAAPHGTLGLADYVRATGAFAAFDVAVGADVHVAFQDGFPADPAGEHGSQQLSGYFTAPILNAPIAGPVPRSTMISLAIGLPVQDPDGLRQAVQQTADPSSASFRKYLSPDQFATTYSPPQSDYQSLIDWAQAKGLTIVATSPNRLLLDVSGTAEQVERALFVGLNLRLRPDGSKFYAVDRDPSLDFAVKLLWISGLDNRVIAVPGAGSGPGGTYNSSDLHAAYASCTALTGAGQTVGLFELDGFTANDISAYECQAGGATCNAAGVVTSAVPNVTTVLLDGATGAASTVAGSFEAALDIEMAIGMAPGLAQVQVFEAPNVGNTAFHNDILNRMATTVPLIGQLSSSWFFTTDNNTQQILYQLALQGQSFFQAAGDQGSSSWGTDPGDIRDLDAVTVVGGTTLTLTGSPSVYGSETTWNANAAGAGGGGIANNVSIPGYQTGIDMTKNNGSTTKRNLPDVAAVAANLAQVSTNPTTGTQTTGFAFGTSAAAPIWAALVAIANQQSQSIVNGAGPVGNANAFLYSIGKNASAYSQSFNDVTSGNNNGTCTGQSGTSSSVCSVTVQNPITGVFSNQNTWTPGAGTFSAVAGYDLATGWGTPKCALINELATGATTATGSAPATITYHQVGACNGYGTSSGITSAGPNQAFVLFGLEKIDNSGGTANFAFDPTKLYVQQATQNFFDPSLSIYADILGPFAAVPSTVLKGQTLPFAVSAEGALVVQTVNPNGATEANQTAYFLRYNAASTDPTVLLVKSDALQTSWPATEDCSTIVLH